MVKRLFLLSVLLSAAVNLFSADFSGCWDGEFSFVKDGEAVWYPGSIVFKDGKYSMEIAGCKGYDFLPKSSFKDIFYMEEGTFSLSEENGLSYLSLKSGNGRVHKSKYGILSANGKHFLFEGSRVIFESMDTLDGDLYAGITNLNYSSCLKEGSLSFNGARIYAKNMMRDVQLAAVPWAEGVDGTGIGEWIEIEIRGNDLCRYDTGCLLISNGYVDFSKPQLFKNNSRARRIRISCEIKGFSFEAELKDTGNLQVVNLPEKISGKETAVIRITVLDVYKGEKWDDTCISLIIPR